MIFKGLSIKQITQFFLVEFFYVDNFLRFYCLFHIIFAYLKKGLRDKVDFLQADNYQTFLQVDTMT